jgi:D-alanyl-D-alanine carboxypeptidase/Putative peptidoglycan binding domain
MSAHISQSVGASGRNRRDDVMLVQRLLAQHHTHPGPTDGLCGPRTVHAILNFQSRFLSIPDGRVDPHGTTWRHLQPAQASGSHTAPHRTPPTAHPAAPRAAPPTAAPTTTPKAPAPQPPAPLHLNQALTTLVPKPSRDSINQGLLAVSPSFMIKHLGQPRENYASDCRPVTNPVLKRHMTTGSVGRFRATGLSPAVQSLSAALAQVQREQPAVYEALGTAGMLCCRLIRGSATGISNHSWGTAIDFTLNGVLDRRGDGKVQVGLTLIAYIMNQHGWYWGAAFGTEDAMHFEASQSLVTQWASQIR